ncbi:ead/Ea22-like family protein [Escherichia coli]|nr:ead/Ea22-like family protein [Escherichia coli]
MSNDITALTPEKLAEIRQRYSPVAAPKCHICGAEMTIGAASASRIVYACSGATYDDAGCHYAPGRSIADDHYAQSRVTVVDVSDPDVLALVEALEAKQPHHNGMMQLSNELVMAKQRIAELENDEVRQRLANAEHQLHMAELAKHNLKASRKAQFRKRKVAEKRIAELESRTVTVKLPKAISVLHRRDFIDAHRAIYAYPEAELNAALSAAGIQVIEGDA